MFKDKLITMTDRGPDSAGTLWIAVVNSDIQVFRYRVDFDLFCTMHYERLWSENTPLPLPPTWLEMRAFLTSTNIPDDNFILTKEYTLDTRHS